MNTVPAFLSVLTLILFAIPARAQSVALNDEFATREILPGTTEVHWTGYGAGLTLELNDAHIICGPDLDECEMEGSMWFEWTAPETGVYAFKGGELYGLAVFDAPPPPAPQIPSYSQGKFRGPASAGTPLDITAGERLWIMLFDDGDPEDGDRTSLDIAKVTVAPSQRQAAAVLPATSTVHIRQVTRSEGWWRWTAPASGRWRVLSGNYTSGVIPVRVDGTVAADPAMRSFSVAAGEEIFFHSVLQPGSLGWTDATLTPFVLADNLAAASAQPLTPDADGNGAGYFFAGDYFLQLESSNLEAWFSWVAPRDGVAGFVPQAMEGSVKTYRDDNGTLTRVDVPVGSQRRSYLPVTAGQRYLIAVPAYGSQELRVEYLLQRGSDSFAGAPELGSPSQRDFFDDATSEPGEPGLTSPADRTRWWTVTPATGGTIYLSGYKVRLYTGNSLNSLTLVTSTEYTSPDYRLTSPVVAVQAGTVYRLQVFVDPRDGRGLTYFLAPGRSNTPHDHFTDALTAATGPRFNKLNLTGATAEPGEPPATPGGQAVRTAWLRWTADIDSRILLEHYASYSGDGNSDTTAPVLAVWKGNGLASLTRVPLLAFSQSNHAFTQPSFDAAPGTTYFIQVEAVSRDSAEIDLKLTPIFTDAGACDAFAAALPAERVRAGPGIQYRMTQRATFEPGEFTGGIPAAPAGFTAGTYWIKWTTPSTGVWRFAYPSLWFRPFTLYGDSLAAGRIGLMSGPESSPIYAKLSAGEVVHIGFVEYQAAGDSNLSFYPFLPDISPAVPGIALAKWYGLPSPVNLNAAYSSDGIPLLMKHALGLDPLRNSLPGGDDSNAARWPLLTLNAAGEPSLSFRTAAPFQTGAGVDLNGEMSRDLRRWSPAPETNAGGVRSVSVPRDGASGFLRVKAALR